MKIAIEASWVQGQPTGIGYYVLGLLQGLRKVAPEHEYYLLHWSRSWTGPDFGKQFTPVSYYCGKAFLAQQFRLGRLLKNLKADIYHATAGTGVPSEPPCPAVCTLHDFIRLQESMYGVGLYGWMFRRQIATSVKYCAGFACNSNCTAAELRHYYPTVDNRPVLITPLAPETITVPGDSTRSHLLCLGGVEDRKGQLFLLDVYRYLLKRMPEAPPLIFAGPDRGDGDELTRRINLYNLENRVSYLGYVDKEQKQKLYSGAILFLMPSKREGFGIPLLEAMQCHTPVVASNIPIFQEVAGSACLLVEGWEIENWATEIRNLINDCELKKELVRSGAAHAAKYTWERTADLTLQLYELSLTGKHESKR